MIMIVIKKYIKTIKSKSISKIPKYSRQKPTDIIHIVSIALPPNLQSLKPQFSTHPLFLIEFSQIHR